MTGIRTRSGGRALAPAEREEVLAKLHEERFADLPVPQVHAALLAEGVHLCSQRTMYRILDAAGENIERRNVRHYVDAVKPQLLATRPNQLWSWDITKLRGPTKWKYFHLYVMSVPAGKRGNLRASVTSAWVPGSGLSREIDPVAA